MQVGSLVICLNGNGWYSVQTNQSCLGPRLNEIVTISGFPKPNYITFMEYPELWIDGTTMNYPVQEFREIQPPMDIDIELIIKEPQTI